MPFYNAEKTIQHAINSILNQSIKPQAIILINDGSTDSSLEVIEDLVLQNSNLQLLNSELNLGIGAARNLSLNKINNDYIIFFDSDDLSEINRAQMHAQMFIAGSNINYVSSIKKYPNNYTKSLINSSFSRTFQQKEMLEKLLLGTSKLKFDFHIPASTLGIEFDLLLKLNGFDSRLRRLEDVDLALRATNEGVNFGFTSEIGVVRLSSHNQTKEPEVEFASQRYLLQKYLLGDHDDMLEKQLYANFLRQLYFERKYIVFLYHFSIGIFLLKLDLSSLINGLKRVIHDIRK
jgi:glycosyltransferase involved in cell wall biosynthesis